MWDFLLYFYSLYCSYWYPPERIINHDNHLIIDCDRVCLYENINIIYKTTIGVNSKNNFTDDEIIKKISNHRDVICKTFSKRKMYRIL